jgi:hypothetical protein
MGSYNRYELLNQRGRTFSVGKRQLSQDSSSEADGNAPKTPRLDSNAVFQQLQGQETLLSEMGKLLDTVDADDRSPRDPRIDNLSKVLRLLLKSHENLSSIIVDSVKAKEAPTTSGQTGKNLTGKQSAPAPAKAAISREKSDTKRVKNALREAEKKTVIFNLNMGKTPAMNKETLSRKVIMALSDAVR